MYLYDIIDIKKKRATRLSRKAVHDTKPISFNIDDKIFGEKMINLNIRKN